MSRPANTSTQGPRRSHVLPLRFCRLCVRTGAPLGTLEDAGARARSHTVPPSLESHTRRRGLPPFKLPVRTQWHPAPRRSCPPYQGHCRGRRMARLPHGAAASRSSRCLAGARVLPSARGRRSSVRWRESQSIPTTRATDRVDWPRKSRQCLASKLRFGKFSASLPASAPWSSNLRPVGAIGRAGRSSSLACL